jgi:hypothetical protein
MPQRPALGEQGGLLVFLSFHPGGSAMSNDDRYEALKEIGRGAMESIAEMVAALECDYERLQELRDERDSYDQGRAVLDMGEDTQPRGTWAEENPDDAAELEELEEAAGDCTDREDAEQRIQEDPLSLQFRSGWANSKEEFEVEEFELLLSTGGPAVRIIGEVRDGEPHRPRLQAQDWGTAWTDYLDQSTNVLETYCRCFCFGE